MGVCRLRVGKVEDAIRIFGLALSKLRDEAASCSEQQNKEPASSSSLQLRPVPIQELSTLSLSSMDDNTFMPYSCALEMTMEPPLGEDKVETGSIPLLEDSTINQLSTTVMYNVSNDIRPTDLLT